MSGLAFLILGQAPEMWTKSDTSRTNNHHHSYYHQKVLPIGSLTIRSIFAFGRVSKYKNFFQKEIRFSSSPFCLKLIFLRMKYLSERQKLF